MFEYFPKNYPWSLAVMSAIGGGAIGEVDEACRSLQEASVRNDALAQQAWYESWKKVAERVEALAMAHEGAGQYLSAGRKYLRASPAMAGGEDHRRGGKQPQPKAQGLLPRRGRIGALPG